MKTRELIRRSSLYIGIAVASLAGIALLVAISLYTGLGIFSGPWLALTAWTGFLLWWAIKSYRSLWRRVNFWLAIIALLSVHLPAWLIVLQHYPKWRPIWFIPFVLIEGLVFSVLVDSFLQIKPEETRK